MSETKEGLLTEGTPTIEKGVHSNGVIVMMTLHVKSGKPTIDLNPLVFKGAKNPTYEQLAKRAKEDTGCENAEIATAVAVRMSFEEIKENCKSYKEA